jgi:hypothetical protein
MPPRLILSVCCVLALATLVGCTAKTEPTVEDDHAALQPVHQIAIGTPDESEAASPAERGESLELIDAIVAAAETADDWQAADREVRHLLERAPAGRRHAVEQWAAYAMLSQQLLPAGANGDEAATATIADYVTMLLDNGSPEAQYVYAGLQRLDGYWGPEQIAAAAASGARFAEEDLQRRADCSDCTLAQLVRAELPGFEPAERQRLSDRAEAALQLREMAR